MIKSKKAVEIAMNMIIFAAIGLLVLVVIIFIFTGKTGEFSEGAGSCAAKQGRCVDAVSECAGPIVSAQDCTEKDPPQFCCVKLG